MKRRRPTLSPTSGTPSRLRRVPLTSPSSSSHDDPLRRTPPRCSAPDMGASPSTLRRPKPAPPAVAEDMPRSWTPLPSARVRPALRSGATCSLFAGKIKETTFYMQKGIKFWKKYGV
ncbi:hypothetical protein VPH35_044675 [Triticum aestivum]